MTEQALTITQVNEYIRSMMDRDQLLNNVCVKGEISNYKLYPSGHHYFTLKDESAALKCVMFKGNAFRLRFRPENGMKIIAMGKIGVYPRDGAYQLYCTAMMPDGMGDLHVAFEQLKALLAGQGLFASEYKKPLPRFPERIALITSPAGAAVRDMLRILGARYPMAQVRILPVRVQGEGAAQEIAAAIRWADRWQVADLIITGRGGGSMEDLWAFNEEVVARAIFDCTIPVISAVGHEPDVTIADYVADLRAATPSNGAELAVPDQNELYAYLLGAKNRLAQSVQRTLLLRRRELTSFSRSRCMTNPENYFKDRRLQLDYQGERMSNAWKHVLAWEKQQLGRLAASLDALSPLKVLGRGYSIATDQDGKVVSSVQHIQPGDYLGLRLEDGTLKCRIEERKYLNGSKEEVEF